VKRILITLIVTLGVVLPTVAVASRVATGSTQRAIDRAATPQLPSGIPERCLLAEVATEDGGTWATARFKQPTSRACGRWAFDGVVIVHRARGHWHYVTAGSALIPCGRIGVPARVRRDLHLPYR